MATAYLFFLSNSCNVISGRKHHQFPHTDTSTRPRGAIQTATDIGQNSQRTSLTCASVSLIVIIQQPSTLLPSPSLAQNKGFFRKSSSFSSNRISIGSCISAIFCENLLDPVLAGLAPTVPLWSSFFTQKG